MLEQLHRALAQQTKYLDELFDLAPDAIVLTEMNPSRIVRVNREFTRMFGYTAEEAVGRSLRTLIAPGEMEAEYAANAAVVAAGRTVDMDVVRQRKDGTRLHVHFSSVAIKTDDGKTAAYLVYRDITDRKRIEEALRLSEGRYALAMEAAGDGHTDWNLQTGEHYISPRLLQICGHAPGSTFRDRAEWVRRFPFHPEDRPKWEQAMAAHFAGRESHFKMELRIVVGGEVRWTAFHFLSTRDAAGTPIRWTGSIGDITEHKRAEEALRESEGRYERVVAASQAGFFDWDLTTDRYHVSPRLLEMAGIPPGTKIERREDFQRQVRFHPEDIARWQQDIKALFASGGSRLSTDLRVDLGGGTRWYRVDGMCFRDAAGKVVRWTGSGIDVTPRKVAEEALRLSEERYAVALEVADEGHLDWNVRTDEFFASAQAKRVLSVPPDAEYRTRDDVMSRVPYHPDDAPRVAAAWRASLAGRGVEHELDYRILRGDEPRWIRGRWKIFRDPAGAPLRVIGIVTDVTDRKHAVETLRESEGRFRSLTELSSDWYWKQDENLRFVSYMPPEVGTRSGVGAAASLGRTRWEFENTTPLSSSWEEHKAVLAARQPFRDFEYVRVDENGTPHYTAISGVPTFDGDGRFTGYEGVGRDITARKQAEDTLRESEGRFRRMTELSADTYWEQDENFRYTRTGEGADIAGYATDVNQGKTRWELCGEATPLSSSWEAHKAMLAAHQPFRDFEYRRLRPDGTMGYYSASGAPMFDAEGRFRGYQGVARDITERKRVEEALRQSEERYALAVAGSNEGIFDWDLVSDRVYVSYRAQELFGLPRGELWRPRRDWRHILTFHPDDASRLHDGIKAHIEGSTPTYDVEFRIVLPGGGVRWFRQRGIALRDASGKAYRVVGSIGDVTEKHKAEEELSSLERKLRLAQRLEAMGTLAGGIAHDFNNILGAILGYGEMALRDAPKGSRLARDLDSIVVAGERGRALVDRVLSFSRSAVGERVPVHVEKVVREAIDLLSAKLPPNVTLHAKLHSGRAAMLGDATQVHQVLMNLVTNAVHAMPAGGTLRVSLGAARLEVPRPPTLGTLRAGEYLVLEVADSGTGIAPEILDRIFDPFFTTKDVGTGTGLGLSLVHGIVTEVGGAIDVASTPGAGSTFTVFLPRSGDALESAQEEEPDLPRGDGQRVLVVDDEEPLVRLATRTLEELGYEPTGFTSSAAALAAFRADPHRFDALITDERMPGMSGSRLIREVRGIRGGIPIVLMSGYVGGAVALQARAAGAEEVLQKPLSARDLAASLARVLQS